MRRSCHIMTDKLENQSLVLTNVTLSCSIWCTKHFTLKLTLVEVESNNRYSSSEKVLEDPPSLHRVNFYHSKSRLGQFFEILVFRVLDYWLSNFVVGFYEHLVKSRWSEKEIYMYNIYVYYMIYIKYDIIYDISHICIIYDI